MRKGIQGQAPPPQWSLENCHGGGGEGRGRRRERRNIELESKCLVAGSTRFNLAIFFNPLRKVGLGRNIIESQKLRAGRAPIPFPSWESGSPERLR